MHSNSDILVNLFDKVKVNNVLESVKLIYSVKYVAAITENGNIGVTATLGVEVDSVNIKNLNFDKVNDRIVANALVNALVNYSSMFEGNGDIFEVINFEKYRSIVMIGYFGSLVKKFENKNITINAFDLDQLEMPVLPMEQQAEYLKKSDCVIVTSTSIANGTLSSIIKNTPLNSDVYMLGPSTPMDNSFFEYPQVKGLFGSVFRPNDNDTLSIISNGGGTRQFIQFMQKVYMVRGN